MKIPSTIVRRTRRLSVRPYRLQDFDACVAAARARRPKQHRFDEPPNPKMLASRRAFAARIALYRRAWARDLLYVFGVFDRRTGEHLGRVDLAVLTRWTVQTANLGYSIHNQHWGQGLAQEAVRAAIDIAFRELALHRLEAGVDPANRASLAVARGAGMRREGRRPHYYFEPPDGWVDSVFFTITPEDLGLAARPPRVRADFFAGI